MIAVIDVSGNNLTSLANALERLNVDYLLTHDPQVIQKARHVILPGVGTASSGMQALHESQLIPLLQSLTQPILGICLGMQLMMEFSEEGNVECLGMIPGRVQRIIKKAHYPVPHMGWNQLQWCERSLLAHDLDPNQSLYFVHGYAVPVNDYSLAICTYSQPFTAIIKKNNCYGMQFHPEKSAASGLQLLRNFCALNP